ncbi:MAG TPA: cell wall hydrolase [Oscillospiraceae bacterium]|nr:cell wall hydrolase [Oscillospiraceae bacterium]
MNKKLLTIMITTCFLMTLITGAAAQTLAFGARELQIGDRGEDVAVMQEFLNQHGYREGHLDGVFGPMTYGSLKAFQKEQKLKTDGVLAEKTLTRMQEMMSEKPAATVKAKSMAAPAKVETTQTLVAVNNHNFTEADLELFARLVHAESAGEPFDGQVAVAATILNRVENERYPNTISGVVYQVESGRYQYSPVLDGRINQPASESAKRAVREALKGLDPTAGATGFYNPAKTSNAWVRSHPVTTSIGSHVFFKY